MSNALFLLAQTTTSAPAQNLLEGRMLALLAPCLVALFVWTLICIIQPEKFTLRSVPERTNRLNPLQLIIVFITFIGVQHAAIQGLARYAGVTVDHENPVPAQIELLAVIAGQVVLIIVSLLVADLTFEQKLGQGLGLALDRKLRMIARGVAGFLIVVPLVWVGMIAGQLIVPLSKQHEHDMLQFLRVASPVWIALTAFSAAILAPIAEEIFFRGLLQSMLRRYFGRPWVAIVVTSFLFAGVHAPNYQDLPALAIFSVALGYNYERCGKLWPSIIMHACLNGSAIYLALNGM